MINKQKIDPRDDWRLDKLELNFENWGEDKGNYTGRIRFCNGDSESFSFKIRKDMAKPYIDLISSDIVRGASNLGERLVESLGLLHAEVEKE
jgi:hypothetical protein